ncbi:zinc-ribbon domain-containing protein [Akkermansiaceae bacterium]|nr:zinc-ribbon domain-containing protein [Akkermansiaceae bacterium]
MNLQIECPACQRRFQVNDDLTGKTVECGACDHRFAVTEDTKVEERKKFYPGEQGGSGLDHFGRAPMRQDVPVTFQTAEYAQGMDAEVVHATSPIQTFASLGGGRNRAALWLVISSRSR